jgi:hypothetical protein
MRIHSQRYRDDFVDYLNELEHSAASSISIHRSSSSVSFFKAIYPLFVLLETLSSFEFHIDPTRRLLIGEYLERNQKPDLLRLARSLNTGTAEERLIQEAIRKETFTPFFKELYSDGMLLTNHFYLNNYRGCHIQIRNLLEDLLRHLFYKDHKEEFNAVESEYSKGLSPQFFREYLARTSYLKEFENVSESFGSNAANNETTLFGTLERLYAQASGYVHASKETHLTKHSSNAELIYDGVKAALVESTTREFVKMCVAFLAAAHLDQFMRLNEYEKSIILKAFAADEKHRFRRLFNV